MAQATQRGRLRFCQNEGIHPGVLGEEGSEIWEPWLNRGCMLLVGWEYSGLSSWRCVSWCPELGWVEVVGGEDNPIREDPGSGSVLEHILSRRPRGEEKRKGNRHFRPVQPHSFPSTLPHLAKSSLSMGHFTLITHLLCAPSSKVCLAHSHPRNHCLPLASTQILSLLSP